MMETAAIRSGEELDAVSLENYLCHRMPGASGTFRISQFPAGSSNLTYLIVNGGDEYVLRRPPFGNTVRSAHDMRREFDVLSRLSAVYPPAPKPFLFCEDISVIGSQFYVMERRQGLIIRGRLIDSSPIAEKFNISSAYQVKVCRAFIENLANLHALDYSAAGLSDFGRPDGYARRQVEGWAKRYFAAKTDQHIELESVIEWLNANIPVESDASLVHNDYKFDNVMFDPQDLTRITAVLDWEMVTVGDPLMDLGTTLGYWMSPDAGDAMMNMPFNPHVLMACISRRELAEMYAEFSGRDVSNILFYYVFGTFKVAVIAQQIYARFAKGHTRDNRFANFNRFVAALGRIAASSLEKQSI